MKKYTKQEAIKVITDCAVKYCTELLNKKLLFVLQDQHKGISIVEVSFFGRNFLHLTGLVINKNNVSANSFLKKCKMKKLSPRDFEFRKDGTTEMKLNVLPMLISKDLSAKMIGDYNNYGFSLYTEKLAGNVKGCIGFRVDSISKQLVPNTILNCDIRKCTIDSRGQVIATLRKNYNSEKYAEVVYKAKKVDWSQIELPDEYLYLLDLIHIADKKVIFLDWNGTLSNSRFFQQLESVDHPLHDALPKIEKWLFNENKPLLNLWMKGKYTSEDILQRMSDDIHISRDVLLKELKVSCESMVFMIPDIQEIIQKIRSKGIYVVIATDNMDCFSRWTVPALKLNELFDDILNSSEIGVLKEEGLSKNSFPFFDKYLEKYGRDKVVLIDDSKNDFFQENGFERILLKSPDHLKKILSQYC